MKLNCGAKRHHYSMFNVGRSRVHFFLVNLPRSLGVKVNYLRLKARVFLPFPEWDNKLANLAVDGRAEQRTAEYRITNFEGLNRCALSIVFIVIDRIPSFDTCPVDSIIMIRYSMLVRLWRIRFFEVSSSIRLDARGQRRCLYETSQNDE